MNTQAMASKLGYPYHDVTVFGRKDGKIYGRFVRKAEDQDDSERGIWLADEDDWFYCASQVPSDLEIVQC